MQFLRDLPTERAALEQALQEARQQLVQTRDARLLGRAGELARVLGYLDEAIAYLQEAYVLSTGQRRLQVANGLRLATTLQYQGDYIQAEALFRETLAAAEAEPDYLDFAYHHFGKCLVEMDRFDEAEYCFNQALKRRGDKPDLRRSTETALAALAQLKGDGSGLSG